MSDILKIILGLLVTVAGFYFTTSMLLAQKQLVAATRLAGYLLHWQNWVLEHDFFGVYYQGVRWNEEEREIRKRGGGAKEAVELAKTKKKDFFAHFLEGWEKMDFEASRPEIIRNFQRMPKESASLLLESSKITKQNIVDGKTFISDEEAASLGVAFTNTCIELKMGILDLVDLGTPMLLALANAPKDVDPKSYSADVCELAWKAILVSKNIDAMAGAARAVSSKSVAALTLQNIRTGSRLSKR